MTACASVGRPGGGPRDDDPPRFVRSNPAPGELGVTDRSYTIVFDENIQLEDAFNKVVVSPVQLEAPQVSANGRRVSVRLRDSLKPNTTYTIDFGDAIKDLNEGNVLDGFALDFSTGDSIDSLRVAGIVLAASNLEPAQGMLIGAYSNLADSAIRTLPPDRIARTNQLGQFTLRNLAPGTYRLYALKDLNRDWHWDRSEDVAFLDSLVVPDITEIDIVDSLRSTTGEDSLIARRGIQFLPNDLLFNWFNEDYKAQYLKDYKRYDRRHVTFQLGAPPDTLPEIRIVDGPADSTLRGSLAERWSIAALNERRDSINLWLTDSVVLGTDSLRLSIRYQKVDSAERLVWNTDTLRLYWRDPKKSKKELEADTLPPRLDLLTITPPLTTQDVYKPLSLTFGQPLWRLDTAAVRLEKQVDTLWVPQPFVIEPDSLNPVFMRQIRQDWDPGAKYRFTIDSAAIVSVYGEHNKPLKTDFTVHALEDYSNLTFMLTGADSTAIVELLNTSDSPVYTARSDGNRAVFKYVSPGTYYARVYFDTNGDGKWTTGLLDSIQPEEVAYYPKKLDLKRNWDIEQAWDIYELPIDRQKPYAILKNKPKLKRGEEEPRDDDDESAERDDFLGGSRYGSGHGGNRNNQNLNIGGLGGFQQQSTNPNRR